MFRFRTVSIVIVGLAVFAAAASRLEAASVDLRPPANSLGSMNQRGQLRLFQDIGTVHFGPLSVAIRFDFSSTLAQERSDLGWSGWRCGLLEARAVPEAGLSQLRFDLLCAKSLRLRRDGPATTTYTSPDGAWKASLEAGRARLWRGDGWELVFDRTRIIEMTDDEGRTFVWERDELGHLLAIREDGQDGAPGDDILILERDPGSRRLHTLRSSLAEYRFQFSAAGELSRIEWDLGTSSPRSLALEQETDALAVQFDHEAPRHYRWDPANGRLLEDPLGEYRVTHLVGEEGGAPERFRIALRRNDGKLLFRETVLTSGLVVRSREDGALIVERRVEREGAAHGMISRIDLVDQEGDGATHTLLRNHFRADGRLVRREWRGEPRRFRGFDAARIEGAFLTGRDLLYPDAAVAPSQVAALPLIEIRYEYDAAGRHMATYAGEELVLLRERDSAGRVVLEEVPGRFRTEITWRPDKTREVAVTPLDRDQEGLTYLPSHGKADILRLGAVYDDSQQLVGERFLDGRTRQIERDDEGRVTLVRVYAPDGETLLETREIFHREDGLRRYELLRHEVSGKTRHTEMHLAPDGRIQRRLSLSAAPAWVASGTPGIPASADSI